MRLAVLDHRWSLALFRWAQRRVATQRLSFFFARVAIWVLLIVAALWHGLSDVIWPIALALGAGPAALGLVINVALGRVFPRERPFMKHGFSPGIGTDYLGKSFPSDHALFAVALALPICLFSPWWGLAAVLWAIGIAIARVLVGVHYLSDILAGAFVAACSTAIVISSLLVWARME